MEARRRKDQRSSRALACAIKLAFQGGRCRQAAKAGSAVESLLASYPPIIREAWIWMRGWYKEAIVHPQPQAIVVLATTTAEMEELYQNVP